MLELTSSGLKKRKKRGSNESRVNAVNFYLTQIFWWENSYLLLSICQVVVCIYETIA